MDDDYVAKLDELRRLRQSLRGLERRLAEYEGVRGNGINKAQSLVSEAQDLGLYTANTSPEIWEDCVDALRQIHGVSLEPEEELTAEGNGFDQLQRDRTTLVDELRRVKDQLAAAEALAADHQGFSREGNIHLARLRSVELFDGDSNNGIRVCPVCQSELSAEAVPAISEIEQSINRMHLPAHPHPRPVLPGEIMIKPPAALFRLPLSMGAPIQPIDGGYSTRSGWFICSRTTVARPCAVIPSISNRRCADH